MSRVTSSLGRARNSSHVQRRGSPTSPTMEKPHWSSGVCGVGPAERTGKSVVAYWPGGTRSRGTSSRPRPLKPREMIGGITPPSVGENILPRARGATGGDASGAVGAGGARGAGGPGRVRGSFGVGAHAAASALRRALPGPLCPAGMRARKGAARSGPGATGEARRAGGACGASADEGTLRRRVSSPPEGRLRAPRVLGSASRIGAHLLLLGRAGRPDPLGGGLQRRLAERLDPRRHETGNHALASSHGLHVGEPLLRAQTRWPISGRASRSTADAGAS